MIEHPLNCKTCTNKTLVHGATDTEWLDYIHSTSVMEPYARCKMTEDIISADEYKRTCIVGCASHLGNPAPIPKRMNSFIVTAKELERLEEACVNDYGEWIAHIDEQLFDNIRSRPYISKQDGDTNGNR